MNGIKKWILFRIIFLTKWSSDIKLMSGEVIYVNTLINGQSEINE